MTPPDEATTAAPAVQLPLEPGRWTVDPLHSGISFSIRHLGLSKVRGRFDKFDAWLEVGAAPEDIHVEATVDMASVDTNQADRDEHLRGADFFYVERYPEMRFTSTRITGEGSDWQMAGQLTILGETHPFEFDVEFSGVEHFSAPGHDARHAGFEVSGEIQRSALGLDFGIPASAGVLLGDKVRFDLDLQFVEPQG